MSIQFGEMVKVLDRHQGNPPLNGPGTDLHFNQIQKVSGYGGK